MSTKVAPQKIDELAAEFKKFSGVIEDQEKGMNKEISSLIQNTNYEYTESYVRSTTREAQSLLEEIRKLSILVTERLNNKADVLKKAAERYRTDEENAKKTSKKSGGFHLLSILRKVSLDPLKF